MDKKETLAKYLQIEVDQIEVSTYDSDTFVINPHKRLRGNAPQYYIDTIAEFKKLLSDSAIQTISKILNTPKTDKEEKEKAYTKIKTLLQGKPVIKDWLYNENILYWLISTDETDKDTHQMLKKAWFGQEITDNRELEEVDEGEYLVLTDEEADEKARESLEGLVDDMLPKDFKDSTMREYFDEERYIQDVIDTDGRGNTLASYDGGEIEEGEYYIYRTN